MQFTKPAKFQKVLLIGALAAVCASAALAAAAPASAPAQVAKAADTPYANIAKSQGVVNCVERINQITSFITGQNPSSGMVLNAAENLANKRIVASVIEVAGKDSSSVVSASFAPGAGSSECSGTYDAVTYWEKSCADVGTTSFTAFKSTRPLLKNVTILDGGENVKVFLMPAGSGCISIKKEILY